MNDSGLLKEIYLALCKLSLQATAQEPPQGEQSNNLADHLIYAKAR